MSSGVELTRDQPRDQAAEGRANFMRACGEPFAYEGDDAGRHAREAGRKFDVIHSAIATALCLGFVLPSNAE